MNPVLQLVSDLAQLVAPLVVIVLLDRTRRIIRQKPHAAVATKVKRELVRDLEPPKRTVDWQHVADLERDIYRKAFHHDGVPCCCARCKRKRAAPKPRPVLERSPAVFPIAGVTHVRDARIRASTMTGLRDLRRQTWEHARAILESAAEGRLSPAEVASYDQYMDAIEAIDRQIKAITSLPPALEVLVKLTTPDKSAGVYSHARCAEMGKCTYGLNYIDVTALGDPEPRHIAADPHTQWHIDYERGQEAARDLIRSMERNDDNPPEASSS